jgi:hypothetical protein
MRILGCFIVTLCVVWALIILSACFATVAKKKPKK